MALFIRQQLSPYYLTEWRVSEYRGRQFEAEFVMPAMKWPGSLPYGRSDFTGHPSDWKPDVFGYTDRDDYHLNLYGA